MKSGYVAIASISPVVGFSIITFPPLEHLFSSTACFKYFSAIDWTFESIVKYTSLPFCGATYFSSESGIASSLTDVEVVIFPFVPFRTESYCNSTPSSPWLSVPQTPIKFDARLL